MLSISYIRCFILLLIKSVTPDRVSHLICLSKYPILLLLIGLNVSRAAPADLTIAKGIEQILLADSIVLHLDSLSSAEHSRRISYFQIFFPPSDSKIRSVIDDAAMLRTEIDSIFGVIRRNLKTMADFQVYPSLLQEMFLSSVSINSAIERLRFELGQKENEKISMRAELLAYMGLFLAGIGIAVGYMGIRGKMDLIKKYKINRNICILKRPTISKGQYILLLRQHKSFLKS